MIDGVRYKTGMGVTKKEARLKAATLALEELLPTLGSQTFGLPETPGEDSFIIKYSIFL